MKEDCKIHSLRSFFAEVKSDKKRKSKNKNHFQYSADSLNNSLFSVQNQEISDDEPKLHINPKELEAT